MASWKAPDGWSPPLTCGCKKGRCGVCDSRCKRCCCACDGDDPIEAIGRKFGQKRKKIHGVPITSKRYRKKRKATANANKAIQAAVNIERNMNKEFLLPEDKVGEKETGKELATLEDTSSLKEKTDLLLKFFGLLEANKNLPSMKKRTEELDDREYDIKKRSWSALRGIFGQVMVKAASILLPTDPLKLVHEGYALKTKKMLLSQQTANQYIDRVNEFLPKLMLTYRPRTPEYRVTRALFKYIVPQRVRKKILDSKGVKMGHRSSVQATIDLDILERGGSLASAKWFRVSYDPRVVTDALKFIFSDRYCGLISWGVKHVRLDKNEIHTLPKIIRKKQVKKMYEEYFQYCKGKPGFPEDKKDKKGQLKFSISRSSFHRIVAKITSSDEKLLTAVDYVTGLLLNDSVHTLQDMVEDFCCGSEEIKQMTTLLSLMRNFLKNQYKEHIKRNDGVDSHGLKYALDNTSDPKRMCGEQTECKACKFPLWFLDRLIDCVGKNNQAAQDCKRDALYVIGEIRNRIHLYMGHLARVVNQDIAIEKVHDRLRKKALEEKKCTECIWVADWKMKYEARGSRETTSEHFGKRGIGWHGILMIYYDYIALPCRTENGDIEYQDGTIRYMVYMDQILDLENKQDVSAVASMLEAALVQIKDERKLPNIEKVLLQSDNAKCYSTNLAWHIGILNGAYAKDKIQISEFLHTETQNGKGLIDAHFAIGTYHLIAFLKEKETNKIKKIATPAGLAAALAWNGGIQNSIVQLVRLDRNKLSKLGSMLEIISEKSKKFFSRANHIYFMEPQGEWIDGDSPKLDEAEFIIKAFAYSEVGDGIICKISLKNKMFEVLQGTDSQEMDLSEEIDEINLCENDCLQEQDDLHIDFDVPIEVDDYVETDDETEDSNDIILSNEKAQVSGSAVKEVEEVETKQNENVCEKEGPEADYILEHSNDNVQYIIGNENSEDLEEKLNEDLDDIRGEHPELEQGEVGIQTSVYVGEYGNGDPLEGAKMVTGVYVVARTKYRNILGPRRKDKRGELENIHENKQSRKDMIAFSVRQAIHLLDSEDIKIRDGRQDMEEYDLAASLKLAPHEIKKPGWGIRPKQGQTYGTSFIKDYKAEIEAFFEEGEQDSTKKKSPDIMIEKLKLKYPGRYSLPGYTEVRQMISSIIARKKKELEKQKDLERNQLKLQVDYQNEVKKRKELKQPSISFDEWIKEMEKEKEKRKANKSKRKKEEKEEQQRREYEADLKELEKKGEHITYALWLKKRKEKEKEERTKKREENRRIKLRQEYEKFKQQQARLGQDPISFEAWRTEYLAANKQKKKAKMPQRYVDILEGYLNENVKIKPADAVSRIKIQSVRENGEYPEDFPSDSSIKAKLNNLKRSLKQS